MIRYTINTPETGSYTALIHADAHTPEYHRAKDAAFLLSVLTKFQGWTTTPDGILFKTPAVEGYARHTATREAVHKVFTEYYRHFGSQIFPANERILDRLVRSDVLCCVSGIVEFCLSSEDRNSPFKWDDAENLTATVYGENQWRALWDGDTLNFCRIDEDGDDTETVFSVSIEKIREVTDYEYDAGDYITTDDLAAIVVGAGYTKPEAVLEEGEDPASEEEHAEVYEWWALDSRLWDWLKDAGEVVIDSGLKVWGRQTSGQAIALDSVIARLARENGILYGQKNEWVNN